MSAAQDVQRLFDGGFTREEVNAHIAPDAQKLRDGGFSESEIAEHFGIREGDGFDEEAALEIIEGAVLDIESDVDADPDARPDFGERPSAKDVLDKIFAPVGAAKMGFEGGILPMLHTETPPEILPEDAPMASRIAYSVAQVGIDLPIYGAGGFMGMIPGGGVASTVTGMAGAFAFHGALRSLLVDTYTAAREDPKGDGQIKTWEEFWARFSRTFSEFGKGYTIGGATGLASVAVPGAARVLQSVPGSPKVIAELTPGAIKATQTAAEVTAMVGVARGLEGQVPDLNDFAEGWIVIKGLQYGRRGWDRVKAKGELAAAKVGTKSLMETYRNTGRTPSQVMVDARTDPTIKEDLLSVNHNEKPRAYRDLEEQAPEAPKAPEAPTPTPRAAEPAKPLPKAEPKFSQEGIEGLKLGDKEAAPDIWGGVWTGKGVELDVHRGSGREEAGSVYAPGTDGPALGAGRYSALAKTTAEKFGPNVESGTVRLENPYVLESDGQLKRLAGMGPRESLPREIAGWVPILKRVRAAIEDLYWLEGEGGRQVVVRHDGVIINVRQYLDFDKAAGIDNVKRLREVFGDSQVVEFAKKERVSASPTPRAAKAVAGVEEQAKAEVFFRADSEATSGREGLLPLTKSKAIASNFARSEAGRGGFGKVSAFNVDVKNPLEMMRPKEHTPGSEVMPEAPGVKVIAGLDAKGDKYAQAIINSAKEEGSMGFWENTRPVPFEAAWRDILIPQLQELGFDGIRYSDAPDTGPVLAVFSRDQLTAAEAPTPRAEAPTSRAGEPPSRVPPPAGRGEEGGEPPQKKTGLEEVKERISFDAGKKERRTLKKFFKDLYVDWVNDQQPLRDVSQLFDMAHRAENEGKPLSITRDPAKLKQGEPGVVERASSMLEFGPMDFNTYSVVGKGLPEILRPVDGRLDDLSAYLVAARTLEVGTMLKKVVGPDGKKLEVEVSRTGVSMEAARKAVEEGREEFGPVQRDLVEFNHHILKYLYDSGLIGKESFDAMLAAGKDYAALNRVMNDEAQITSRGSAKGAANPVFRFRGNDELIIQDPLENLFRNTYTYVQADHRNQIRLQLVKGVSEFGIEGVAQRVKSRLRPIKLDKGEVSRATKKWSEGKELTAEEAKVLEDFAEDSFTIFRPNGFMEGEGRIIVYEKGERQVWEINKEIDQALLSGSTETNHMVMRAMASVSRGVRAGATYTPEFGFRNLIRDLPSSYIYSKHGLDLFLGAFSGIKSVLKRDADYQNWLRSGGPMSTLVGLDRQYLQQDLQSLMRSAPIRNARNVVRHPIEGLKLFSELFELGSRLGEFKAAMKSVEGTHKEKILEAGIASRDVVLDFNQAGRQSRPMNRIIPFFAAHINGQNKVLRAFKERPLETLAKTMTTITIPSVILHLHNREQEWYQDMPRWQKDLFWLIKPSGDDEEGIIYRIPKPFELGVIFGTGAEYIVDAISDSDPDAFSDFLESFGRTIVPGLLPAGTASLMEAANWPDGKRWFSGTPLIPGHQQDGLAQHQYQPYTTELTKALGGYIADNPFLKKIGFDGKMSALASPIVIENFVRTFGGVAVHGMHLLDWTMRKAGIVDDPEMLPRDWADIPVVKAFVVRHPSYSTQPLQDFWEEYSRTQKVRNSIRRLSDDGNFEAAQHEIGLDQGDSDLRLENYARAISKSAKAIRQLNNPKLRKANGHQPDEAQQLIDQYLTFMNLTAKKGLEVLDDHRKFLSEHPGLRDAIRDMEQ